jgi:hypothetical protein
MKFQSQYIAFVKCILPAAKDLLLDSLDTLGANELVQRAILLFLESFYSEMLQELPGQRLLADVWSHPFKLSVFHIGLHVLEMVLFDLAGDLDGDPFANQVLFLSIF